VTALALTPQPATASVSVSVTAAPAGAVTLTRTDINGTAPVRLRTGQAPIAGTMVVQDNEPALTGPITYQVVDSAGAALSASTALGIVGARIASVQLPSLSAVPEQVTGYDAAATSATVVHWPVDRGDPVVICRPARTREGSLTVFSSSSAAARTLAGVIAPGRMLMLRQSDHPGLDMYFVPTDRDAEPVQLLAGGRWVWTVTARYVEVKPPAIPLLGNAGWTFADLTARYATFSAVRAAFPDFAALTVGPSS
jgi:hypothetical protein